MAVAVFWWTGKGYLTAITLLAVFSAFGIALPIGASFLSDTPAYWGLAAIVSAIMNWAVGRRVNVKSISAVRSIHLRDKLIYRARHKFMSLPLELWAFPMAAGGLAAIAYDLARP